VSDPKNKAQEILKLRCAACHGERGKGDGPAAVALTPKPRDWTDAAWNKTVTDERLAKVIVSGGQAVGLSPLMTPNPDLANEPAVVNELVRLVRLFAATK
jgi:hypothetical protein